MVETIKVVSCLELLRRATCCDVRLVMEIKKKWRHKFSLLIYVETRYKTLETCSNSHAKICRRRNSFHVCELCSSYRGYPMWSRRATHRCDRRRVLWEIVSGWKWEWKQELFVFMGKHARVVDWKPKYKYLSGRLEKPRALLMNVRSKLGHFTIHQSVKFFSSLP